MVSIKEEIKDELYTEEDYVHWDSDLSSDDEVDGDPKKRVDRLSTLSLKTIFSRRCLGKVPRKLRKLRTEKFDMLNEFDMSSDINNIINNLGDESANYDSDSLLEKDAKNEKLVVNSDFDSIFGKNDSQNDVGDSRVKDTNDSRDDVTGNSQNDVTVNSQNDDTGNSKNEDSQNHYDSCQNDKNKDNISMGSETDASADESNYNSNISESKTSEKESEINTENLENDSKIEEKHLNHNGNIENSTATESDSNNSVESDKVNGESEKKSDIETARLMDEIEAQIDGGYQADKKCEVRLDLADSIGERKSVGLENISDEEFNFDA